MIAGTAMAISQNFASVYPLSIAGTTILGYSALWSVLLNFFVAIVGTLILNATSVAKGSDETAALDYTALSAEPKQRGVVSAPAS
jgi:hypothetical protein